jgi:hypothetical protein
VLSVATYTPVGFFISVNMPSGAHHQLLYLAQAASPYSCISVISFSSGVLSSGTFSACNHFLKNTILLIANSKKTATKKIINEYFLACCGIEAMLLIKLAEPGELDDV